MLDAYIIDQFRKEQQERTRDSLIPLYIEPPPPPGFDEEESRSDWEKEEECKHGVVIIDYFGDSDDD